MFALLKENKIKWISLIILILCILGINKYFLIWWPTNAFICLPFFYFGYTLKKSDAFEKVKSFDITKLIIGLILLVIISLLNGYTDLNIHMNGKNFLLFIITANIGTFVTINLSYKFWYKGFRTSKVFEIIGRNSIIILLTHYYICRWIVPKIFESYQRGTICNIVFTVLIMVFYFGIFCLARHFRKLYDVKS